MTPSHPIANRWIPALSGYRALAALSVFIFHLVSIDPPDGFARRATVPLGNAAVCVFFVLSGFLIYRPFARWAFDAGPKVAAVQFIARRAVRILPLYWVVLTIYFFVFNADQSRSWGDLATAYGLVQNFRGILVFLPPFVAWSLCIELWFSVALPLLAGPIRQLGRGRQPRTILGIQLAGFALMLVAAVAFREWAITAPDSGRILWVPAYLDWFAGGLALATWVTYREEVAYDKPPIIAPNPTMAAAIALVAYWAVTQLDLPNGFETPSRFQIHAQFLLQFVMAVSLVGLAVWPGANLGSAGRFLSARFFNWAGALSYGVYLIHSIVIDELIESFPDTSLLIIGPVAIGLCVVIAHLLHYLVEKPSSRFFDSVTQRITQRRTKVEINQSASTSKTVTGRIATLLQRLRQPTASWALPGATAVALVVPFLHRPGEYIADARYELFADPVTRLYRTLSVWDATRDFGRPAEEVWPGVTGFASALSLLGLEPWVIERAWHGALLALALLGASKLARELASTPPISAVIVGLLYAFGPFSAVYLIPSTLYVSHMVAPWLVFAVVRASRKRSPLAWAAVVALIVFGVGNADPPGLVFAAVPAITCLIGLFVLRPASRKPLLQFGFASLALTAMTSAVMVLKTVAGAEALSQRLLETEPAVAVAASSSFTESVRGMGFWLLYFRLEPSVARTHQIPLVESWQMMLFSLVPIFAGLLLLTIRLRRLPPVGFKSQSPATLDSSPKPIGLAALAMATTWFVIGTVAMVGPYPTDSPSRWGRLLLSIFEQSDLAFSFRSSHKAGVISALGVALLGGWALGELARRRSRPDRTNSKPETPWFSVALVCLLVAGITQPFWRTSLYHPTLTNEGLPEYWVEVGEWFENNPPQGRVLVLPGSTNNGYRWGSVGDDLLDPIVPNRLTASTAPQSTPVAAEVTDALDRYLSSSDYQPGAFQSLAQRYGISHVLFRNDLDWQTQGLASPSDFNQLRGDPELVPVQSFGSYSSVEIHAVEIYAVAGSNQLGTTLIPAVNSRRQILLEGDSDTIMRLSSAGLLKGGHPVRYASAVPTNDLIDVAEDTALVVIADTKLAHDRRITYYGYNYALPALAGQQDDSGQLRSPSRQSTSIVGVPDAQVSSSVDRWAAGTTNPPTAAIDGNRETAWLIPILNETTGTSWTIELSSPTYIQDLTIDLYDPARRTLAVEIRVDGKVHSHRLNDGVATAKVQTEAETISATFTEVGPGSSLVGIREVNFGASTPLATTAMPTRIAQLAAENATLASNLEEAELLVSVGHDSFSTEPMRRTFRLWRADEFTVNGRVRTDAIEPYCADDLIQINGMQVPVQIEPDSSGYGRLGFCDTTVQLELTSGSYSISIRPDEATTFSEVHLTTMNEPLTPLRTSRIDLGSADLDVAQGDLLVTSSSFDEGWQLGQPGAAKVIALNGLTGFAVSKPDQLGPVRYGPERRLTVALWFTGAGLALCLCVLVGSAARRRASDSNLKTGTFKLPELPNERRRPGVLITASSLALAWLAMGWMGALAVALVAIVAVTFGAERLWFVVPGVAIALVADLVLHLLEITSVDLVSKVAVAALGAVIAASVHRWRSLAPADEAEPPPRSTTNDVNNAVPRKHLTRTGN